MRSNTEQQPGRLAKASSLGARQASAKPSAPASARATARSTSARPMASPGAGEGNAATSVALAELRELYAQKEAEARSHTALMRESIQHSQQTLQVLREENLRLQAEASGRPGPQIHSESHTQAHRQLEHLEARVHELRRQHDRIAQEKKTTLAKLQNQQDSLQQLQAAGGAGLGPTNAAQARAAREMRQLANRLDKAVLKYNEAQSIRHTYDKVLEQLQSEQLTYDKRVKGLEATLKALTTEHQQALLTQRNAQRAKEAAKQELSAFEEQLATERAQRQAKLQAQREAVETLGKANTALFTRALQSTAATAMAKGGLITGAATALDQVAPAAVADRPVSTPQEAVAALLAALPTCRIDTLCDHLIAQQETHQKLTDMKTAAVHQVGEVTTQLETAEAGLESLQSANRTRSTQSALDAAQTKLRETTAQADTAKATHDQVLKAYIDVRAGVEHLASMLIPLPLPPGHIPVPLSDDTLADVLAQCHQRLVASVAFVRTIPKAAELLDGMMSNPELNFGGGTETGE